MGFRAWVLAALLVAQTGFSPGHEGTEETRLPVSVKAVRLTADGLEADFTWRDRAPNAPARLAAELLNPEGGTVASGRLVFQPSTGADPLTLPLTHVSEMPLDLSHLPWLRMRYRVETDGHEPGQSTPPEIVSLSEIVEGLFALQLLYENRLVPGETTRIIAVLRHPLTGEAMPHVSLGGRLRMSGDAEDYFHDLRGETGEDGTAQFDVDLPGDRTIRRVGGEIAAIHGRWRDTVPVVLWVDNHFRVLVESDRPLYQPGQTAHLRVLVFDERLRARPGAALEVRIRDPEGNAIYAEEVETSPLGVAAIDWSIPPTLRLGRYEAQVTCPDLEPWAAYGSADLFVSRYELPQFEVTVEPEAPYWVGEETATIRLRAAYLTGQPVADADVIVRRHESREWDYERQEWIVEEADEIRGRMDSQGRLTLPLAPFPKGLDRTQRFEYGAYVTDPTTGRTEQADFRLIHAEQPFSVTVHGGLGPGIPAEVVVVTRRPDGASVSARVRATSPAGKPLFEIQTNELGLARYRGVLDVDRPPEGQWFVEINLEAVDQQGQTAVESDQLHFSDKLTRLSTDQALYSRGDPIHVRVETATSIPEVTLVLSHATGIVSSSRVVVNGGDGRALLPDPGLDGPLLLSVHGRSGLEMVEATRMVHYPDRSTLQLEVTTDAATYRPGAEAELKISLANSEGGVAGVAIIDRGLDIRADEMGLEWEWDARVVGGWTLDELRQLGGEERRSPVLDLAAEVLQLSYWGSESVRSRIARRPETDPRRVFSSLLRTQYDRLVEVLHTRPGTPPGIPTHQEELWDRIAGRLASDVLLDPWGQPYRPRFGRQVESFQYVDSRDEGLFGEPPQRRLVVDHLVGYVSFLSSGPDRIEETGDDFEAHRVIGVIVEEPELIVTGDFGTASLAGLLADPTGGILPGVRVTATAVASGGQFQVSTDDRGRFQLADLPAGYYALRFELTGFRTRIIGSVPLNGGMQTDLGEIVLRLGEICCETVIVAAATPGIQLEGAQMSTGGSSQPVRVRRSFPETLLWEPQLPIAAGVPARRTFRVADSMTEWQVRVTATTPDGRLIRKTHSFRSFQPFFIDLDPPPRLTQGDQVGVPFVVRNYSGETDRIQATVETDPGLRLVGVSSPPLEAAAEAGQRSFLTLEATAPGSHALTVRGEGRLLADAVEKRIQVEPPGRQISRSRSGWLTGDAPLEFEIPPEADPGSLRAELTLFPHALSHVIDGAQAVFRRPWGCAEQNISAAYPSLLLLQAESLEPGSVVQRTHDRARRFLWTAYSRLLADVGPDGGLAFWSGTSASAGLTAYALRFLTDASEFLPESDKIRRRLAGWLLAHQGTEGGWGAASDTWSNRRDLLTAAVIETMAPLLDDPALEPELRHRIAESLLDALDFLEERRAADTASLLTARIDGLREFGRTVDARQLAHRLEGLAVRRNGEAWWPSRWASLFGSWGRAFTDEITAGVVDHSFRHESQATVPPVIEEALLYLLRQKDAHGLWGSAWSSVGVMRAFVAADEHLSASGHGPLSLALNGRPPQSVRVDSKEPVRLDLTPGLRKGVNVVAMSNSAGDRIAGRIEFHYRVPWTGRESEEVPSLHFDVEFDRHELAVGEEVRARVDVHRLDPNSRGMLLVQVGLPPGVDIDRPSLASQRGRRTSLWDYEIQPDRLVLYLWPDIAASVEFAFRPRYPMRAVTAPSSVTDYYNPDYRVDLAPQRFVVRDG